MRLYYGGEVVYQQQSDEGIIEVVDLGNTRSLHFGTFPRQSSMTLTMPYTLELAYTQSMMACLLLNPDPERILVVGLGGGSLVKFLLHHFPDCRIDVVEYRQDVIDVAQRYFYVPEDDPRLTVYRGDGYVFVQQCHFQGQQDYDLLLVDAYDHVGMAASVGVQAFFDACAAILCAEGVMSINLWGSDKPLFNQTMMRINQSFPARALVLPVRNKGNVIALATRAGISRSELKKLRQQAAEQEIKLRLPMTRLLQELVRQNSSFISRWLAT